MDAPMPEDFGLVLDPSTRVESAGRMLLGGSPFRIVTLSDDQAAALAAWQRGEPIGAIEGRRRFARALAASNLAQPRPPVAGPAREAVDVVVPVRDRPRQLRRLLQALATLPDSGSVREVIVVDDASKDQDVTARIVEDGRARLVRRTVGGGVAAARNSGTAATAAPFIAFIDSDCVPEEGWLAGLLPHFADPLVGAVAPRVVGLAERGVGWLARYEDIRSPLDRGTQSARDGLLCRFEPFP
jgi:mycofactocin glycosyltransferase